MNNFNKAIIQWNNVRWIIEKAREGLEQKKENAKGENSLEIDCSLFPLWDGNRQEVGLFSSIVPQDLPSKSLAFFQVLELLDYQRFMRDRHAEIPSECYSCANYSGSSHLKCAINPKRISEEDCSDFEAKASDESGNERSHYQESIIE
jgi:hypothetical protein